MVNAAITIGALFRVWEDEQDDYRTDEIAINWSAALIYALAGFLDARERGRWAEPTLRRLGILMIMNINGKISIVTLRSTPR